MQPANLQQEWARTLLWSLADAGVRRVVISPGSRSTPFVLAALEHPDLDCIDLLDERVAAFYALGQARASGRASLLICTSGTAAANYFPAVIEAGADHVPLLVLSADRPLELSACGANQTIDQQGLYGRHARRFFDLGIADPEPAAFAGLRRIASQAVQATVYPLPGAVHLNARARKPLEPPSELGRAEVELKQRAEAMRARPSVRVAVPVPTASEQDLHRLVEDLRCAQKPLVVCGPAPIGPAADSALVAVVQAAGAVLLAETASQQRFAVLGEVARADHFDTVLRSSEASDQLVPDLVLQLGRAPTCGAWAGFLRRSAPCHWVVAEHGWHDPTSTADQLLMADPSRVLELLCELLTNHKAQAANVASETEWQADWRRADRVARQAVDDSLVATGVLSEGAVARQTVDALPDDALVAVGNSLPIRHVDTFCSGRPAGFAVWSQRGASGIDGVICGSAGAAGILGRPAALLIGDVSFLHDLGGLAAAARLETAFAIVVIQNQGGRIFEQLPLASHSAAIDGRLTHWTTPHELQLAPAAELFGLPHQMVSSSVELKQALELALGHRGATVIEARVPPGDAAERRRDIDQRFAAVWCSP